jgi:hypothetical protein
MKYKALGPINHDGQHYNTGDQIELSNAEAAPLLEVKAIEPYHKPFGKVSITTTVEGDGNV